MNFLNKLTKCSALIIGLTLSVNAMADAASDLKEKLSNINTFEAQFSQSVLDEQGNVLQQGTGKIALAHPLKIYWQQVQPDETLFVSDGDKTYYYDTFAEQVTVMNTASLIDTTPFVLLTSRAQEQWAKYQVTQTEGGYQITPNDGVESQVEMLEIEFSDNNNLQEVRVKDVSGQVSSFIFSDAKLNNLLATDLFSFIIPKGVIVDDQTQSEL
ncbi:outer membrane lipoprotein chaperone LolA [Pseudoalteromonas sp. JBTF-M23]|uniref:Outer-membrane lipoprotein carrier protein n=1 Tax=Pseudoalteromonas caenipelagi TaxID=2726988 RepID=A0A849V935_9GAMM|nr:outer membrane lipoprotein chaperone LolA [Pseudoalteromonas caenipelagi]NOU49405.1 outer membrane lipoprotein chaperone LolA [Pseudoalteromonas caenipelagi]